MLVKGATGLNVLGKDNYKTSREAFKFWDLVRLLSEIRRLVDIGSGNAVMAELTSLIRVENCRKSVC